MLLSISRRSILDKIQVGLNFVGKIRGPDGRNRPLENDVLLGIAAIAEFLGTGWTIRKVRYAREIGAMPIRAKKGVGIYAFKSELLAALRSPDSLP
jgi:hypothetical protein